MEISLKCYNHVNKIFEVFSYWSKNFDESDRSIPAHFSVNFNVSVNESDSELFNFEFATSKNFDCFAISVTNINSRIRLKISIFLKFMIMSHSAVI